MKCDRCNGTGRRMEESDNGIGWIPVKCEYCNGTGEVEQTNEEWFDTLPTTKKADFMAKTVVEVIKEHNKCGTTRCESVIWWDEWLKQPHTKEGTK